MNGIGFILIAIVVSIYILIGSFWAWLIGVEVITLPWFAMVVLWPVIGFMLLIIAAVIVAGIVQVLAAVPVRGE